MTTTNESNSDEIHFGHHVVALIDFLGQRKDLLRWNYLPQNKGEEADCIAAIRDTYGRIMQWRELFEKTFAQWKESAEIPAWIKNPTPQEIDVSRKFQESSLDLMHFSDTIVAYSPITNQHGYLQAYNVCAMITTCGTLLLAALAQKIAWRGAIEIGMAGRFPQTDLYGPGVENGTGSFSGGAEPPATGPL